MPFVRSRPSVLSASAWVLPALLATVILLAAMPGSLPYLGYVDEGAVLHPVSVLLKNATWDTGTYLYPSLVPYLIATGSVAVSPLYESRHGQSLRADVTSPAPFYDFVTPPALILVGRLVSVVVGVLTVLLAALYARRIAGPGAGLLAGLFAALCPALVFRGSIVIVDTVAAFFALCALYAADRIEPADTRRRTAAFAALAGTSAGFAFASKYTLAVLIVPIAFAVLRRCRTWPSLWRSASAASLGFLAGAAAGTPPLFLRTREVVHALREQAWLYSHPTSFDPGFRSHGYLGQFLSSSEAGFALAVAGAAGFVWMLVRSEHRQTGLTWLAFGLPLCAVLCTHAYRPIRNLQSLFPLICISAAVLVWMLLEKNRLAGVVALVAVAGIAVPCYGLVRERRSQVDTRQVAVDWLALRAAGRSVLVQRELAILPGELGRAGARIRLASWREMAPLIETKHFDFVVACPLDFFGDNEAAGSLERPRWERLVAALHEEVSFGTQPAPVIPNFWRSNSVRIRILSTPFTPVTQPRGERGAIAR